MKKILKIALGIILLIVVGTGVLIYEFTKCDENSLKSNYNFGISLTTDLKLENPTFYFPLPVFRNETMMVNMANMIIIENERKTDGVNIQHIVGYGKKIESYDKMDERHRKICETITHLKLKLEVPLMGKGF